MCSNGTHHFTTMKPYDPVEIGELNDAVNNLRSQLNDKDMQLNNAMQQAIICKENWLTAELRLPT